MIKTENIVSDALSQAVETMAFMDIFPPDEEIPAPVAAILAEINFFGPAKGTFQLLAGKEFAAAVAENYAAEDDVTMQAAIDAMKELVNITCGLIIPMISHSKADIYDLSVPLLKTGPDCPSWSEFTALSECRIINTEGMLTAARLKLENTI